MFLLSLASLAHAGGLQATDNYALLTETCGKTFTATFDAASFEGTELGPEMGLSWCAQALDGLRTTCTDEEKRKDVALLDEIRCVHDAEPKMQVATRVEGSTLILGINRKTGNLKSDVYEWTMRMPAPAGALSAQDRKEKEEGEAQIAADVALTGKYCRNKTPLTVEIDWASFAPVLEDDAERKKYGYSGIYGGCSGIVSAVSSLCTERFEPEPAQLSPSDQIKGFRCAYTADAAEPVMSLKDGIVTGAFNQNTANVVSASAAFVREQVPKR